MAEEENIPPKQKLSFPRMEEEILSYWEKERVFERTLQKTKKRKRFVFYEGPPYANGRPGIHHVLARAYKDVILRFKTMQGYYVPRKAGWDTHGLPTEIEVEKKLHVRSKKEIATLGIEKFVEEARNNVFEYKAEWEKMTKRMGYWLDLDHPYVTMANDYIESLWQVFSRIAKNGYLYKDYKVLPWCQRCETSLSSHEVAQGYQTITDTSVIVKFQITKSKLQINSKFKILPPSIQNETIIKDGGIPLSNNFKENKVDSGTNNKRLYILAWTTTPWTLPGNVALAVNPQATYVVAEKEQERLILAESRLSILGKGWKVIKKEKGNKLVGVAYQPLYESTGKDKKSKIYQVVSADFVTTDDGTGIVHIAPAFGADDQKVGKKYKLPTLVTVEENGAMKTPGYPWDEKLFSDANPLIIKDLADKKLLFKKETYTHDYPFCWRCKSALMYYAKDSWFLKTTAVKTVMQKENARIAWHPDFVGKARFGEWLKENVDWAISRERYWGMPLPIWKCAKCDSYEVISSLADLDRNAPRAKTQLYVMRHGEATHNKKGIVGPPTPEYDKGNTLTGLGKEEAQKAARRLKGKIDVIIASPLRRAQETARIVAEELKDAPIETYNGLHDIHVGEYLGKKIIEADALLPREDRFEKSFPGGEGNRDVRARMMEALSTIISLHRGKRILIVSHGDPLWILAASLEGKKEEEYAESWYPNTGNVKKLRLHNWPYNTLRGELDLHRPYIDEIMLRCKTCKGEMRRVPDVADVWFDSGAMPFAQNADSLKKIKNLKLKIENLRKHIPYPADYICEGIDQTRGWFYTLLAVSSLLKLPAPYKNVITVGLVLDEKGEKMSKSRGNAVEPFYLFEKYGADAVRWYFYTVNQPCDEKLFDEKDVAFAARKFLMIFWNVFQYWKGAQQVTNYKLQVTSSKLLINRWLCIRLQEVTNEVVKHLEQYDVVRAARLLEEFVVEDISHWYIRRIRDIMKTGKANNRKETSAILGFVLHNTAILTAPFIPFLSDAIFSRMGGKSSIHAESWPQSKRLKLADQRLLKHMKKAREIVSAALQERAKAGIKVRQPLASLKIRNSKSPPASRFRRAGEIRNNKNLLELIKGEVNVKKIVFGAKISAKGGSASGGKNEVELDTVITSELKQEGICRDLMRQIQDARKAAGLAQKDKIVLTIGTDEKGKEIIQKFKREITQGVNAKEIKEGDLAHNLFMKTSIQIGDYYFEVGLKK